jgi:hypothetical protein
MSKTIYGKIREAKYYPTQKSIALIIEDLESGRQLRPAQIHASSFTFPDPSQKKIDEEMEKTADLMKKCKFPIRIVFEPETLEEEKAWFGDLNAIKNVYGDDWAKHIKTLTDLG